MKQVQFTRRPKHNAAIQYNVQVSRWQAFPSFNMTLFCNSKTKTSRGVKQGYIRRRADVYLNKVWRDWTLTNQFATYLSSAVAAFLWLHLLRAPFYLFTKHLAGADAVSQLLLILLLVFLLLLSELLLLLVTVSIVCMSSCCYVCMSLCVLVSPCGCISVWCWWL